MLNYSPKILTLNFLIFFNLKEIERVLCKKNDCQKPRLIISHTIKGHGISFMEGIPIWHYRMPNEKELELVKKELKISEEELAR